MYYSRFGLRISSKDVLTACQRYRYFKTEFNHGQIKEQALTFALELREHYVSPISDSALKNAVAFAFEAVKDEVEKLEIALSRHFYECTYDVTLGPDSIPYDDTELHYAGIADVGLILDTSIYALDDDTYQQQLAAALALQLDIW